MIEVSRLFILILLVLLLPACDTQEQQDNFADQASRPPSGYARTDEGGTVLSDDEDDWRTSPVYAGRISVEPAYPNPATSSDFVTIQVNVTAFESVYSPLRVERLRSDNRLEVLDEITNADVGLHVFTFSAAELETRGLHRVFIFDGVGELISYGDIMVE